MPSRTTAVRSPSVGHEVSHAVVERLGAALAAAGFPPMPARVFAALLVDEDGRMTAAEIAALISAAETAAGVTATPAS